MGPEVQELQVMATVDKDLSQAQVQAMAIHSLQSRELLQRTPKSYLMTPIESRKLSMTISCRETIIGHNNNQSIRQESRREGHLGYQVPAVEARLQVVAPRWLAEGAGGNTEASMVTNIQTLLLK